MIERHTFYVIYFPTIDWGDDISPGYMPCRGETYVKALGLARHYEKKEAEQILAKEKLLCPGDGAKIRKVEATYFMEKEK